MLSPNEIRAVAMVASFFVLLLAGIPVGIGIASSALLFGYLGFGPMLFSLLPSRIYSVVTNYSLMAVPLFVFMGLMLEKSRLAGGMAVGIVLVGVLLGASTGIVGATIVTLGLLTLPALLRRGYAKGLATGTICASGTLGQIIPPSLVLILLSEVLGLSVGTLFAAAMLPGLVLAAIYVAAIILVAFWRPDLAPPIDAGELAAMSRGELLRRVVTLVLPPLGLVVAVLGSIIGGVAAPTEAASMGAIGALVIVIVARKFSIRLLFEFARATLLISTMVFFILICAQAFALSFRGLGGEQLVHRKFA